jgi:hypothetical protein
MSGITASVAGADSPQAASSVKRKDSAVNLNGAERFSVVKVIVVTGLVIKVIAKGAIMSR